MVVYIDESIGVNIKNLLMVDVVVNQYNENPTITEKQDNEALIAVVPECLYIPTITTQAQTNVSSFHAGVS